MKRVVRGLAGLGVAMTLVGFVLPWARINLHEPAAIRQLREAGLLDGAPEELQKGLGRVTLTIRRGTETLTGSLPSVADLPRSVSGLQVPQLARQEQTKLATAVVELLLGERQHLPLKSYAVYLLPGLALLCGGVLARWGRRPPAAGAILGVCAVVAAFGFWKLLTTPLEAQVIAVTIGEGLWLSLWGYVVLALGAGISLVTSRNVSRAS